MLKALSSGVSGLTNHQSILDITANNLSNVSTYGFKGSRVSFATALSQQQFAGTAPTGGLGGVNPRQVGLGVTTSSIDVDMRQGSLLSTGRNLDLAIQGNGFFSVTDGTRNYYTRVGNFGFDSNSTLVDLGSGKTLVGNLYSESSQTVPVSFGVPLSIPNGAALPSRRTSSIELQGNLDATSAALQGTSVQSLFPLIDETSNETANEDTLLSDLTIFADAADPGAGAGQARYVNLFGTKPDGSGWSATIGINPWRESVGDLVERINASLVSGNQRFGIASLDSGNIIANGVGTGSGFSIFFGDVDAATNAQAEPNLSNGAAAHNGGVVPTVLENATATVNAGRLAPTFVMPAADFSAQVGTSLTVTVSVNGTAVGTVSIPAADYTDATVSRTFTIPSFPTVAIGDTIDYDISGDLNMGANTMTVQTETIDVSDTAAMVADADSDGVTDMYDPSQTAADPHAWQYANESNSVFNWYRSRFVPDLVTSTIEVYDALGAKHTLETRMFRTGSKADPTDTSAVRNSWDMIVGIKPGEGAIVDDIIGGIEFDQNGRFTGDVGSSLKGTSLSDATSVGDPASRTIRIDWGTTGTSSPSTMEMDLGTPNGVDGLTGFGSTSTAAAIRQDGYADGKLDSLSVTGAGDIVGLFTNGISQKLAQLQLATFTNPAGLSSVGGSLYIESPNSGQPTLRNAGEGGAGTITSGALEGSNVDIASEFTRLITAQRGFQVNARVIQTTDSVLQELASLIR